MRAAVVLALVLVGCGAAGRKPIGTDAGPSGDDAAAGDDAAMIAEDAATIEDAAGADRVEMRLDAGGADALIPAQDATAPEDAGPAEKDPVIFVHGINGSSADFQVMIDHFAADGWPRDRLFAIDFADPRWGCNADNGVAIRTKIEEVLRTTGAQKVDLVAHSMGTLSSRHYLKDLGGTDFVNTYVTLGGLHHGNQLSCLNPLNVCVWQELCPTNPFLAGLNADPAAPGNLHWVSICSRSDQTAPLSTCHFDPAENIEVDGVDHSGANGLLEHPDVYPHVKRVLEY